MALSLRPGRRLARNISSIANGKLEMPGFNVPLNCPPEPNICEDRFTSLFGFPNALDPSHMEYMDEIVTHRELLMMRVMNNITDKSDWDKKVFDSHITSKWREEVAKSGQDVTPKMMNWIIKELQWKAGIFQKTGHVTVFDSGVVKSDSAISRQLQQELRQAAALFEKVPEAQRDYHPGSDQKVVNLVHPSLFPIVYGRTRVLPDQIIGVDDCLSSMGQGTLIPTPSEEETRVELKRHMVHYNYDRPELSRKFQWLPCDVDINKDSRCEIASYINNVHPLEHRALYDVVKRVITRTIPLWDQSLSRGTRRQRIQYRAVEYGDRLEPEPMRPKDADDSFDEDDYRERHEKWEYSGPILLPEPGDFEIFEVDDWEKVKLKEQFGKSGLQVIVKLANIELTPENPDYEGGTWHIEGQLNERICATSIYYYDNQNITESSLFFRQRSSYMDDVEYEQDRHKFLQDVYGLVTDGYFNGTKVTQEAGGVVCQEGRLLTFPNSVQHKVSAFSLADRSKRGHRKILALFLIDPHRRVISSANVPPQREDWAPQNLKVVDSVHSRGSANSPHAPGQDILGPMMSMKEAEAYRLELMEERSVGAVNHNNLFESGDFSLCEH